MCGEWTDEEVADLLWRIDNLEEKVAAIPSWVFDNQCCPPGESCCNCD